MMRHAVWTMIAAALLALPGLAAAEVPIGIDEPATVRLSPQGQLAYPVAPPIPRAPANNGAILTVDVDEPGRYHVALSAKGWIDMVRDGKALVSAGNRHGAPGSGTADIVDFDLVPGRYVLELSGMLPGEVEVTVSR